MCEMNEGTVEALRSCLTSRVPGRKVALSSRHISSTKAHPVKTGAAKLRVLASSAPPLSDAPKDHHRAADLRWVWTVKGWTGCREFALHFKDGQAQTGALQIMTSVTARSVLAPSQLVVRSKQERESDTMRTIPDVYTRIAVALIATFTFVSGCGHDEPAAPSVHPEDVKPDFAFVPLTVTGLERVTVHMTGMTLIYDYPGQPTFPLNGVFSCEALLEFDNLIATVTADDGRAIEFFGKVNAPAFPPNSPNPPQIDVGAFRISGSVVLPNDVVLTGFFGIAWPPNARTCTITDGVMRLEFNGPSGGAVSAHFPNGDSGSGSVGGFLSGYVMIASNMTVISMDMTMRLLGRDDPAEVALDPADAIHDVGTTHTITATVHDVDVSGVPGSREPISGASVVFVVTGSTSSAGLQCTTNAQGQCTVTYGGPTLPGHDAISAFVDINGDGLRGLGDPSATATVEWQAIAKAPATISLSDPAPTFDGSTQSATVTTSPAGLSGLSLAYSEGDNPVASPVNAGVYQVRATLSNENYEAPEATGTLTIHQATPSIEWESPAPITAGTPLSSLQLNAIVTDIGGVSLSGTGTYTPAAGTVLLAAPLRTLSVVFDPADPNYTTASAAVTLAVRYRFAGFFQPVDNPALVNQAKAGSAIPVKFSLGGDQGLGILQGGAPTSGGYACGSPVGEDLIEETASEGSAGLTYDAATGQYKYVWKTNKAWAGGCRKLVLALMDGTKHEALFHFK